MSLRGLQDESNVCDHFPITMSTTCMGNGVCDPTTGVCECAPNYTGLSDWVNGLGKDCQVYIPLVQAFWYLVIVLYGIITLYAIPKVYTAFKRYQEHRTGLARVGKKKKFSENGALLALMLNIFFVTPFCIGLAIVELTTTQRVGIDWTPTILYMLWRASFYWAAQLFQPFMLGTILGKTGKNTIEVIEENTRFSNKLLVFILLVGFVIIGAVIGDTDEASVATFIIYNILVSIFCIGTFVQARMIRGRMVMILDASYAQLQQESIKQVKTKLVRFQSSAMRVALAQCVIALLQGIVPFFWNKFVYFLPLSVCLPSFVFLNAARQFSESSKNQSTTKGGSTLGTSDKAGKLGIAKPTSQTKEASTNIVSVEESWAEEKQNIIKETERKLSTNPEVMGLPPSGKKKKGSKNKKSSTSPSSGSGSGSDVQYVHGLELSMHNISNLPKGEDNKKQEEVEEENPYEQGIAHKTRLPTPTRKGFISFGRSPKNKSSPSSKKNGHARRLSVEELSHAENERSSHKREASFSEVPMLDKRESEEEEE